MQKEFSVFNSSSDILTYFFELGNRILKSNGCLSFIVSNKFFKVKYGENIRTYLVGNTSINQIIEFDKVNIFDEATVKCAIIQFSKEQPRDSFTYVDVLKKPINLKSVVIESGKQYEQALFIEKAWIFQSNEQDIISNKIHEIG